MPQDNVKFLLDVYLTMISENVVPSTLTYSIIIQALVERYLEVRKLAVDRYSPVKHNSKLIDPALDQFLQQSDNEPSLNLALDIFFASTTVRLQEYSPEIYNMLLEALAETNQIDKSLSVLEVLERAVREGKGVFTADTFIYLIRAFQKDIDSAVEIFESYKAHLYALGDRKETAVYSELIRAYFRSGDSAGALTMFEKVIERPTFDSNSMFTPLADTILEEFTTSDRDAESVFSAEGSRSAWLWLNRITQDELPAPSPEAISKLLSANAFVGHSEIAEDIYDYLLTRSDITRAASGVADYISLLLRDDSAQGASKVVNILETVLMNNLRLDMHTVRDVAVYLLENPAVTEDMAHQAFMFVQVLVSDMAELSKKAEIPVYQQLLELTLVRMLSLVNWAVFEDPNGILSRAYVIARNLDFVQIARNAPQPPISLQLLFSPSWNSLARNEQIPIADFDNLVYLHARAVGTLPKSEFADTVIKHLSTLLSIAANSGIILSKATNHYVTLAAPQIIPPESSMVPMEFATAPIPLVSNDTMPNKFEASQELSSAKRQQMLWELLRYDADISQAVSSLISYNERDPESLMSMIEETYRSGRTISPSVSMKVIEYAGFYKLVHVAERMFSLLEQTIPAVQERPTLHHVWQAIYSSMISMYFQCQEKDSLAHKKNLVEFKNKLMEIGTVPDADAYANFIVKLKHAGSHDEAREAISLFAEARAYGVYPSTYLYNALLSKLSKARKYKEALAYYNEMDDYNLRKTSVTYGTMISACCRAGDGDTAERLFAEMEAAPNYKLRIAPFNTMLQFYVLHRKDREQALQFFDMMRHRRLDLSAHSYKLLIDAYTTIEPIDMEGAGNVLRMIEQDGKTVSAQHYAALITAYGVTLKNYPEARKLFNMYASSNRARCDESMYQALIEACIANEMVSETDYILDDMQHNRVSMTAYMANTLIRGWASVDINKSRSFFDLAYSSRSAEPSTYEAMVSSYLSCGDDENSERVLSLMTKQNYPEPVLAGAKQALAEWRQSRYTRRGRSSSTASSSEISAPTDTSADLSDLYALDDEGRIVSLPKTTKSKGGDYVN